MQSDWRELGSLSEWAVAWATDRTGSSRAGSGSCERCVGRDIEYNNVERARRPSLRGGRDRKLATCQRQFAQRLRYACFGRGNASKCPDTYEETGRWPARKHPAIKAQSG